MRVVGEASTAAGALELAVGGVDVLLLDLVLDKSNRTDLIPQVVSTSPNTRILVVSGLPPDIYAPSVIRAGAKGFLSKEAPLHYLLAAVRIVAMGNFYMTSAVASALKSMKEADAPLHAKLSKREMDVFLALANGGRLSHVALDMGVSIKTAST